MHLENLGVDPVQCWLVDNPVPQECIDSIFQVLGDLDGSTTVGCDVIFLVICDDLAGAVLVVGQVCKLMLLKHGQRGVLAFVEVQAGVDGRIGVVVYADRRTGHAISIQGSSPAEGNEPSFMKNAE